MNLEIMRGTLTICSGPVGAGKSTLANTIKGAIRPVSGTVYLSSKRIGYCDKIPRQPNSTIKEVITCFDTCVDMAKYRDAICACYLHVD
jgi:ATP-binding cassette subfamily C (CFTR/MRP) protein 1